jgi:ABC-type branched-subunit amino acid transport system ATPase component
VDSGPITCAGAWVTLHQHVRRRLAKAGSAIFVVEHTAQAPPAISDWTYVLASGTVKIWTAPKCC